VTWARALRNGGILLILVLAACTMTPRMTAPSLPPTIRVVGSSDMAPLLPEIQARVAAHIPHADIRYVPTNSTTGLQLLAEGAADIALVSDLPPDLSEEWVIIPMGEDDVVIVVYPDVHVDSLNPDDVRRIFEGRYLNWQELGGNDFPIRLVSREKGSGTRALFERVIMGTDPVALTAVVMPSAEDVVHYVQRHEGAIGYVGHLVVNDRVRILAINDEATTQSLHRTLYIVTSSRFAFLQGSP